MNLDARNAHRGLQHIDDPFRDLLGGIALRARCDDQHELISPQTSDRIHVAHDALEALRHLFQKLIPGAMPQRVVHQLEAIEIRQEYGERLPLAVGNDDGLAQSIVHQDPVRQPGEGVVGR